MTPTEPLKVHMCSKVCGTWQPIPCFPSPSAGNSWTRRHSHVSIFVDWSWSWTWEHRGKEHRPNGCKPQHRAHCWFMVIWFRVNLKMGRHLQSKVLLEIATYCIILPPFEQCSPTMDNLNQYLTMFHRCSLSANCWVSSTWTCASVTSWPSYREEITPPFVCKVRRMDEREKHPCECSYLDTHVLQNSKHFYINHWNIEKLNVLCQALHFATCIRVHLFHLQIICFELFWPFWPVGSETRFEPLNRPKPNSS